MHKALACSLSLPQLPSFFLQPVELRLVALYLLKDRLESTSELPFRDQGKHMEDEAWAQRTWIKHWQANGVPRRLLYFQATHSGMLREENKPCLRGETENINSILLERGEGTLHLKVLLAKTRAPSMHLARVDPGRSEAGAITCSFCCSLLLAGRS